jgi:hypothetical protein
VDRLRDALVPLGFAFLATHELDAMTQSEWRLLFVLRDLPNALAERWFVALHVPLFALVVWLCHHPMARVRERSRLALAAFLVVHGVLHWTLEAHPLYTFHDALSRGLIVGASLCGVLYLWLGRPVRREA